MTDAELFRFFDLDRNEEGTPKPPSDLAGGPSYRDLFARRCFLGGVWDRPTVARLWREEQAKQREADR
jgi:hypothetical protein